MAMGERLKVEAGVEKYMKLYISRLKDDARACQTFGQKVVTSTIFAAGAEYSGRQYDSNPMLEEAQNSGKNSAKKLFNNGEKALFTSTSTQGERNPSHFKKLPCLSRMLKGKHSASELEGAQARKPKKHYLCKKGSRRGTR